MKIIKFTDINLSLFYPFNNENFVMHLPHFGQSFDVIRFYITTRIFRCVNGISSYLHYSPNFKNFYRHHTKN